MGTSPNASPRTHAPRRELNPRIACRDRDLRIAALRAYTDWLSDYRTALAAYQAGDTDVVFPDGTNLMCVRHHVRVGSVAARAHPATPPPS